MAATAPQTIVEAAAGAIAVRGPLVFASAGDVLRRSVGLFPMQGKAVIDLAGVTHADSAALALIIEWRRLAAQRAVTLELRGLPAQLRALAAASGLESTCA
jgi:phospholipid transport system transporter-binding protein